ncbi:hypothetical protein COHA_008638 [Chlorella ohadii]|uniref:Uncharacterized protein n=1 Tax=Chlorella ohadii TaxID=2649997 RepID=A0AAD5DIH4_9CHLO|nr:hypothetical protein COHA_008638 [Chlorella ohadii]
MFTDVCSPVSMQRGLQAGVVYTLRNVIPKNPPKDRQDGRRVVDLQVDNFSELDRVRLPLQIPDQVLSSHAEGDTDICLRLDATCALPNDKGGWLLEDAAGTELRLARGQISAQTGQRMQKAFMSGTLVISVQATPVKLVSREERILSGVSKAVQGKKVQTKVAVLSGAGGAPLDAGARQQSGQGQAKRKSGKAAAAAGDSAAAGGGKAAKRVKK